jgi:hypothetical protein
MESRPTIDMILDEKIAAAVASGRYPSEAQVLKAANLSPGYMGELRIRVARNADAGIRLDTAARLAEVLQCPVTDLLNETAQLGSDPYEGRSWAIIAARALGFPERAIQAVMLEAPSGDPGKMWWFRRIEAEAERLAPAASR